MLVRMLSAALVLGLILPLQSAAPARAATTNLGFVSWTPPPNLSTQLATSGANYALVVQWGEVPFLSNHDPLTPGAHPCTQQNARDDAFIGPEAFAFADVYLVPHGEVTPGARLNDHDPRHAATPVGGPGGVFIQPESLGFTGASIPGGTYDLILDECQDGVLDPEDAVYDRALVAGSPINPWPADSLQAAKSQASALAGIFEDEQTLILSALFLEGLDLLAPYGTLSELGQQLLKTGTGIIALFSEINAADTYFEGIVNLSVNYARIAADPPDVNYAQVAPLASRQSFDPQTEDPILIGLADLRDQLGTESALAESLLHELERYQGAAAAGDAGWALAHARLIQHYARLLAAQQQATGQSISALAGTVRADPRSLDSVALQAESLRAQIAADGFTSDQLASLHDLGYSDTQLAQLRASLANVSFSPGPRS